MAQTQKKSSADGGEDRVSVMIRNLGDANRKRNKYDRIKRKVLGGTQKPPSQVKSTDYFTPLTEEDRIATMRTMGYISPEKQLHIVVEDSNNNNKDGEDKENNNKQLEQTTDRKSVNRKSQVTEVMQEWIHEKQQQENDDVVDNEVNNIQEALAAAAASSKKILVNQRTPRKKKKLTMMKMSQKTRKPLAKIGPFSTISAMMMTTIKL